MQDGLHLFQLIVGALVVLVMGLMWVLNHRHKMPAGPLKSMFVVLFVFSSCSLLSNLVRDRWPYAAAALLVICVALLPFGFWLAWKALIQQVRAVGLIDHTEK